MVHLKVKEDSKVAEDRGRTSVDRMRKLADLSPKTTINWTKSKNPLWDSRNRTNANNKLRIIHP